jgi:drug/metabolite transporter (DMT)-like permease
MQKLKGFLFVALSAFCFGLMPILAKFAFSSGAGTTTMLFLRFIFGAVFMFILMRVKRLKLPDLKTVLLYAGMGALGYAGQSFCYFSALNYASASLVALILYVYPALVAFISLVFLKEKLNAWKLVAILLALAGCALIVGFSGSGSVKGIILALTAALIYSVYIVSGSKIIKKGMAIQSSFVIMLSASLVFGASVAVGGFEPPRDLMGLIAILAIVVVSTVLAVWAFFSGLEHIGPTNTSLVSTLEPVVTVVASMFILGERLTPMNLVGAALVILALLILPLSHKYAVKSS